MKRVLIVDDAIDLGRLLQDALKVTHPDTPITVVPSAEEALLESTRYKFDLLITDIRLPGMSGLELIRKIRVRQPEIKVILITALQPDDRLVRQKDEVHPDIFMRKPLSVTHFLEAVDGLIGSELEQPAAAPVVQAVEQPAAAPVVQAVELPASPVDQVEAPAWQEKSLAVEKPLPGAEAAQVEEILPEKIPAKPEQDAQRAGDQPVTLQPEPKEQGKPAAPVEPPQTTIEPDLPGRESIASVLARLRGNLGALAVLLTDSRGNLVSLEGELPEPAFLEKLVPAALAPVDAGAGFSDLLGPSSGGPVQAYRGPGYDLIFTAAGGHLLFILIKTGKSSLRLALAFEEALNAQAELELRLTTAGKYARLVNEAAPPEERLQQLGVTKSLTQDEIEADLDQVDPGLKKLEELFADQKPAAAEDPDSFWETAAAQEGAAQKGGRGNHPGTLSYDEAQELGLLKPGED